MVDEHAAPLVPLLDSTQLAMILSLELQQPDGASPGLIDMFDQETTGGAQRLSAAAASRDWPALNREAHSLKGAASLYGLARLADTAARLEQTAREETSGAITPLVQQLQHDLVEGIAALRAAADSQARGGGG